MPLQYVIINVFKPFYHQGIFKYFLKTFIKLFFQILYIYALTIWPTVWLCHYNMWLLTFLNPFITKVFLNIF